MKKTMRILLALTASLTIFLVNVMGVYAESESGSLDSKTKVSLLGKYDSADTASIKQINTISGTIQFRNHDIGKNYTLKYDNTTHIYDIYGRPISASLLEVGQVVDITFLKGSKHLNSLVVSDYAWVKQNVTSFDLVSNDETAKINGEVLHISRKTLIISDGQAVNPEDILLTDTLRVSGIDKEIYSIVVTRGHGYVSLSSDKVDDRSLVGAWIELDKEVIRKITPNMLISAPEGSYNVSISGNGAKLNSEIVVNRNEETVIDTGVISIQKEEEGLVTFYVTPSNARVFVDGEEVLTETPHSFTYGKHKVHVMADGYTSKDNYLKVAEKEASIFIDLEPNAANKDSSDEASTEDSATTEESLDTTSVPEEHISVPADASSEETTDAATQKTSKAASSASSTTAGVDSSAASTTVEVDSSESTDSSAATTTSSDSSDSSSNKSSDDDEEEENPLSGYKVNFDKPVGTEAYLDGNYLGIVPVSFAKVSGQHMVTLSKKGYETRSYTIYIDNEKSNVTYSFQDLEPEEKSDNSGDGKTDSGSDSGDSKTDEGGSGSGDSKTGDDNPGTGDSTPDSGNSGSGDSKPDEGGSGNSGSGSGSSNPGDSGTVPKPGDGSSTGDSSGTGQSGSSGQISTGEGAGTGASTGTGTTEPGENSGTSPDGGASTVIKPGDGESSKDAP